MPLNDMKCRTSKPMEKSYKLSDGEGLYLEVLPSGKKSWRLKYRLFNKEKRIALGLYPGVGLQEARAKKDKLKEDLRAGLDPALVKLEQRQTAAFNHAQTFHLLAEEWQRKNVAYWKPRYAQTIAHRLERYVYPEIGSYPVRQLTPPIIMACLEKVDATAPEMARRVKQYISNVLIVATTTGRADADITTGLEKGLSRYKKKHFKSMSVDEFPELLLTIYNHKARLTRQTYLAIRLMLLTFVRTKELIEAEWTEIDFEQRTWVIPGERMKMGLPHVVPLSTQAIQILSELKELNGKRRYVFPSIPRPQKPMSNGTILVALKRMKLDGRMTGHGFRSLALGVLKEKLKFKHEVADRQLAHVKRGSTDKAYDRAEFLDERKVMMQRYSNYIETELRHLLLNTKHSAL